MGFAVKRVRAAARERGWEEVAYNTTSRVISFRRNGERVNVYYTSRTVGTCVNHPKRGRTQLFRRNQPWKSLLAIFDNPRVHTGTGYYRKHGFGLREPSWRGRGPTGVVACMGDNSDQFVDDFEPSKTVGLALSAEGGHFVLHTDGTAWWSGLPTQLHNKLWGRQRELPSVDYVALDPGYGGAYFVQFTDGSMQWSGGSPSLSQSLRDADERVEQLVFAPNGGWYLQWEDGTSEWSNLPASLHQLLEDRDRGSLAQVETIACNPDGGWFVRFLNGDWRARCLSWSASQSMDSLQDEGHDILNVVFGGRGHWVILYS